MRKIRLTTDLSNEKPKATEYIVETDLCGMICSQLVKNGVAIYVEEDENVEKPKAKKAK